MNTDRYLEMNVSLKEAYHKLFEVRCKILEYTQTLETHDEDFLIYNKRYQAIDKMMNEITSYIEVN